MSKTFKVGDICIGQYFVNQPKFNNMEGKIVSTLSNDHLLSMEGESLGVCSYHFVQWGNGDIYPARLQNLRPKQPPRREQDEVVSWESVGWMPMDVKLDRAIKQALKDNVKERA